MSAADGQGAFLFPITRGSLGNFVPKELAGTTILTYILAGNFRQAVIGRVGAIELAASEQAGFVADQVWIRAVLRGSISGSAIPKASASRTR